MLPRKQSNDQYSHQLEVNENALELMKVEGETRTKVATLTHSYIFFITISADNIQVVKQYRTQSPA
jgi:hypothetical protein